ncbi:MAG TPA: hypothetical protein VHW47_10755 [Acidimicrobiales bacterium]|jgi:hypothetical protein|nr:hypothetical protein [Acidimicrobiales bacterium]
MPALILHVLLILAVAGAGFGAPLLLVWLGSLLVGAVRRGRGRPLFRR